MTPFVYEPAVYDGTNASLASAVSTDGWFDTFLKEGFKGLYGD